MQFPSLIRRLISPALATLLLLLSASVNAADKVDKIITNEQARTNESVESQGKINKTHDKTGDLLANYKSLFKIVEGLEVYNGLLQKQLDDQDSELTQIETSIKDVALIERQIIPLMVRMIDSLDQFVKLDIPFLKDERTTRVNRLHKMMEKSDVTAAEKFRRVMEAYQIENDYGRTIEAYRGTANVAGKEREVDFLRIGRTSLIYQSTSRELTGMWDQASKSWQQLPAEIYRNQVTRGLKIARKQIAPDLLMLPVQAAEAVK